jgi:mono/diheme cytochrome c family protein
MAASFAIGGIVLAGATFAADEPPKDAAPAAQPAAAAVAPAAGGDVGSMKPIDRVLATEKGKLKNPYTDNAEAIEEGKKIYLSFSCNGCHGGGGGGGMCPSIINETWVYGSDDDTLYRLIILGSAELQKTGYKRIATETVVGPMPPYRDIITDEVKMWKMLAYIRSVFSGRPEKRNW